MQLIVSDLLMQEHLGPLFFQITYNTSKKL